MNYSTGNMNKMIDLRDRLKSTIIYGAKNIGKTHVDNKSNCQDAYYYQIFSDNSYAVAVADGVGSCLMSEYASEFIVKKSVEKCKEIFDKDIEYSSAEELLYKIFNYTREELKLYAFKNNEKYNKLVKKNNKNEKSPPFEEIFSSHASTLLLTFKHKGKVYIGHIGDGIVSIIQNNESRVLTAGPEFEVPNMVIDITSPVWKLDLKVKDLVDDDYTILMYTDGLERISISKDNGVISTNKQFYNLLMPYLKKIANKEEGQKFLSTLLKSKKVNQVSGDDKTMCIIKNLKSNKRKESKQTYSLMAYKKVKTNCIK